MQKLWRESRAARADEALLTVDRPLRRAMLRLLGFADFISIERRSARSTPVT
jgi:hypothetical protein